MRDFNFPPPETAADTFVPAVTPELPQDVLRDQEIRDEQLAAEPLRPQIVEVDEVPNNNTAKLAGGVVVALLIIGGGIYAYEASRGTPTEQVALKTPAQNHAAIDQTAAAPPPAPVETPPANAEPTPPATPAATPAPKPSHRVVKSADKDGTVAEPKTAEVTAAPTDQSARTADAGINAPMTLTPQTAPPAEQAQTAPADQAAQTAMQQPLTAPDVTGQTTAPAPALANNTTPQPTLQAPLPAPAAEASATQPVPAGQLPADQAQQPNAQ